MGNVTTTSNTILESIFSKEIPVKQKKYPFTILTDKEFLTSKAPKITLLYFRSNDELIELRTGENFNRARTVLEDALGYFGCGSTNLDFVYIKLDTCFTNLEKVCDGVLFCIRQLNTTSTAHYLC